MGQKVEVDIVATRHEDDGVAFTCMWEDSKGHWHSGPVEFPYRSGEHDVEFELKDRTGLHLEFEKDVDDAIWFEVGQCPKGPGGNDQNQIVDKTRASKAKLTLKNLNSDACTLYYALRFTGDSYTSPGGNKHSGPYAYDPEFRNRGG